MQLLFGMLLSEDSGGFSFDFFLTLTLVENSIFYVRDHKIELLNHDQVS